MNGILFMAILFVFGFIKETSCNEFNFERIESIPGKAKTEIDFSKWKVVRVKKNQYLSGEWEQKVDMDNTYLREITAQYSPMGNNQFIASPMKIPKTPMCEFWNTTYKKYLMKSFVGHSNIPDIPDKGLCPMPKGIYWAKDVEIDMDTLPKRIPTGLWKIEEVYYHGAESVGGLRAFIKVY